MTAIFTGLGAGFERGSGSVIGAGGLLGSSILGRGGEQVFLNAATGNFMVSQRDEFLVGLGLDVAVGRTYNSLGDLSDDNGDNWRQSTDRRVTGLTGSVNTVGSTVKRVSADGSEFIYSWDAGRSAYVATDGAGAYDTLSFDGTNWTWRDGDSRVSETYAQYGSFYRITAQSDTDGNALSFSYNADKLYRVTTADGSYVQYNWTGNTVTEVVTGYTDLATSTAKTLTRTRYGYDAQNRLTSVTVDLSPNDNSVVDGATYATSYTYDGTSKRVASIAQSDGSYIAIAYDGSGRVASLTQTSAAGVTRVSSLTYGAGYTTVTDPLGNVARMDYNADGSLAKITMPPAASGAAAQVVQFGYNAAGDLTSVTDALSNATAFTYDANGNVLTSTDRLGNLVTRTYGANNELLTEASTSSDAGSPAAAHTVRFVYDGENHLRYRVSAEGFVSEYRYTAAGQLQSTIDYTGHYYDVSALGSGTPLSEAQLNGWRDAIADKSNVQVTDNLYDARGNLTQSKSYATANAAGAGQTTDNWSATNFTYDQAGRLLARNVQGRNVETFVYDGMGRMVSALDVNGGTTSYVFNDAQSKTIVTFASGLIQTSTYNLAGELIDFTESTAAGALSASTGTATYGYDANGRLRWQVDATGNKLYFLYDNVGRKVAEVRRKGAAGASGDIVEYRYDANNRLVATIAYTTQLSGAQVSALDNQNVAADIASYRPASAAGDLWSWNIYDKEGRLLQAIAGDGSTAVNSYDGAGRLVRTTSYATKLTSQQLNDLRAVTPNSLAGKIIDPSQWILSGLSSAAATIDGVEAQRLTVQQNGVIGYTETATGVLAGDTITYEITLLASGSKNYSRVGLYGLVNEWGADAESSAVILSGPGTLARDPGSLFVVGNLSTSVATKIRITRKFAQAQQVKAIVFVGESGAPSATAGDQLIVANRIVITPKDRVSRTFYDKDGRLVGSLDGEGFVTQVLYDRAGRKIEAKAFVNATSADRVNGTFAQLVAGVTAHADDRRTRYVYDGQGQLRFVIDAKFQVTETLYDTAGQVTTAIAYANAIASGTSDFSYANVKTLVAALTVGRRSWTVYDSAGRVAYAIDAENGVTAFAYNASGQVTKAVQFAALRATTSLPDKATMDAWAGANGVPANDRVTRSFYDKSGVLRYVVDGEGYVSRTDVDAEGRVVKSIRWANPLKDVNGVLTVTDASTTDSVHNAIAAGGGITVETTNAYDTLGRLLSVTDGEGAIRRYDYDANGLMVRDIMAWGTADESTTFFVYDGAGHIVEQHRGYGSAEVAITRFSYDGLGNQLSVTDPLSRVTTMTYDRLGQVLTSTNPLAGVTTYQYDAFGNAVKVTDVRGNASYSYYDNLNRLIATRDAEDYVTETSYTVFSQIASVTRRYAKATNAAAVGTLPTVSANAKDTLTSFVYDKLGRVTKTTDAEGYYEQYTLNAFGDRISVRNKINGTVTNQYDRRGLLTQETLPMQSVRGDGTVQAASVTNTFTYDARGNRTRMIEAYGLTEQRTTNYTYDKVNRLTAKILDATNVVSQSDFITTTSVTPSESYAYDRRGNLIQVTDMLGGRTVSYYDDLDRKIGEVGSLGRLMRWTYDAAGNRLTERVYGDAVTVPTLPSASPPAPVNASNYRETGFSYDSLNRLSASSIANVLVGSWNGSTGVAPASQTVTTGLTYDAAGNVVKTTDGNGGLVYAYFDKLGRKTAQVDAEGYLTAWTYDGEGNALSERRYATKWTGAITTAAPPAVATHADDRVTNFTYDKNGHRLTETRTGVVAWSVNTTNGAVTQTTTDAVVAYVYNGLGQVTRKTEATGDQVNYTYDATGRLVTESRAAYLDQSGASVTPTVTYSYNGLNDLSRTQQGGAVLNATTDRITRYTYGANGRLASLTDAAGGVRNYAYDAAGNLLRDSYTRAKSDGTTVNEGVLYTRDIQGRVTAQAIATNNGTAWVRGDSQNSEYTVYGEVGRKGINGLWQESFTYDAAGRLIKNNSGDGVWRFFVYDANGNKTLTLESEGTDLSALTLTQALALAQPGGVAAGSTFVDGINLGITVYDKRNQATASRLPQRELSAAGAKVEIVTSQTYNAFGEVVSQTDARGNTINLTYNTMGRLIEKKSPLTNWTNSSGTVAQARPTETYYYDLGGRLVGSRDANGNLTSRTLLNGTGYGDAEAMVAAEYHADGGIGRTFYDVFGDARTLRNELNIEETRTYDGMGRVVTQLHRGGLLTDNFTYDILGQRIVQWNSFLGSLNKATTDYDLQGRVVKVVAYGGDTTTTSYVWDGTLTNAGMSATAVGGWTQTDTYANSRTMVVKTDMFGRDLSKVDMGGHSFTYTYDKAGRLTTRTTAGETQTTTWLNSGMASRIEFGASDYSTFTYDAAGNHLTEYTMRGGIVAQNATATYDELGRLKTWNEVGSAMTPLASKIIEYDLNGNIMRNQVTSKTFNDDGVMSTTSITENVRFSYDVMNRIVLSDSGSFSVTGAVGSSTTNYYDLAGQRVRSDRDVSRTRTIFNPNYDPEDPYSPRQITVTYGVPRREDFTYTAAGYLESARSGDGTAEDTDGDGFFETVYAPTGPGAYQSTYLYDAMGRVTRQLDYVDNGTAVGYQRDVTYNAKGQVTADTINRKQWDGDSWDDYQDYNTYTFGTGTGYALGAVLSMATDAYRFGNDSDAKDTSNSTTYDWYDGAVIASQTFDRDTNSATNVLKVSTFTNSPSGITTLVTIADDTPRRVKFTTDMSGEVLIRDEDKKTTGTTYIANGPYEVWHRFNGREMNYTTNNAQVGVANNQLDYKSSIEKRTAKPSTTTTGMFAGGASTTGTLWLDADNSYEAINSYKQGASGGRHTVRTGETLQSIAQSTWGDASLWYKLAEANGLSADSFLAEGQALTIPAGVVKTSNNASTFKPYDASETLGDTAPTRIKPPKPKKGGLLGKLLIAVIAIAIVVILTPMIAGVAASAAGPATGLTAVLGGTAAAAGSAAAVGAGIVGGAIAGAVSSVVSQAVGVATGIQDKFDWKGVALSAISGGVSGGLAGSGLLSAQTFGAGALRGAISSAASQGVGVATGLQKKFDWAGVAAAAISSGVSAELGGRLGLKALSADNNSISAHLSHAGVSMAASIANAATRLLIQGSNFGDNVLAGLPDVLGQTIGSMIEHGIGGAPGGHSAGKAGPNSGKMSAAEFRRQYDALPPEGTQLADLAIKKGMSRRAAIGIASDPKVRDNFLQLLGMTDADFETPPPSTASAGTEIIYDENGNRLVTLGGEMPAAGRALGAVGRLSGRIDELRGTYHVDDIMLGVQVLLGPSAAIKALTKGIVGDAALGDMIDWASNAASTRVTSWASGAGLDNVNILLSEDSLAKARPDQFDSLNKTHIAYGEMNLGAKALLTTALGVALGVRHAGPQRPSWRDSELDIGAKIDGQGYRPQVSFKDGVEVPYGTKGSVRPEYHLPGSSIEVKNYNLESARGRSNLIRNITGQALERSRNLPPGTTQNVYIDIRGQNVSRTNLHAMIARIVQRSNGTIQASNINIVR